ncbi:MAG: hypothetical protein ABIW46_03670 [Acidimicrobiales bacterium]
MTTPGRDRWCHHVASATATVECSGTTHQVAWRRGKLVLEDHDLGAEQTMLAFGGEMPACLATLQLWRNLHTWAMAAELLRQLQSRMGADALLGPGELARAHELGLALTWERAWRRADYYSDHGRLLSEVMVAKATPAFRDHLRFWLRERGSRRLSSVRVEVARGDAAPGVAGEMDSVGVRATASLGARWLVDVWGRGLAVVDGGFVVAIDDALRGDGSEPLGVRAVRWDRAPDGGDGFRPVEAPAVVTSPGGPAEERHLVWSTPGLLVANSPATSRRSGDQNRP